jgi:uncharacterized membrane protein YdjX (TVP38/TMEM64 family)
VNAPAIRRARLRVGALAVVLSFVGLALVGLLALNAGSVADTFDDLGAAGAPALAAAGAILIVAMVPAGLVCGAAGFVAGAVGGTVVGLVATGLGAMGAAAIGRSAGTADARHVLGPRVERAIAWFEARPVRGTLTARLVPGTPFNVTSYVLGLTRVRLDTIGWASAVGFAPRCFAYAALGGSLNNLDQPEARAAIVASLALLVLVAVVPRVVLGGRSTPQLIPRGDIDG